MFMKITYHVAQQANAQAIANLKLTKKIPVKDLYIEAPKYIINMINSDGIILSIFFCKEKAVYYMTPTCKISFLENLGGWQML